MDNRIFMSPEDGATTSVILSNGRQTILDECVIICDKNIDLLLTWVGSARNVYEGLHNGLMNEVMLKANNVGYVSQTIVSTYMNRIQIDAPGSPWIVNDSTSNIQNYAPGSPWIGNESISNIQNDGMLIKDINGESKYVPKWMADYASQQEN